MRRLLAGRLKGAAIAVAVFACAGAWLSWNITASPYQFHPDERIKVRQMVQREWNFKHPQLLLRGAEAANIGLSLGKGIERDNLQRVAKRGRFASAAFGAGAIVLLGLFAWRQRGWAVAVLATLAVATGPNLVACAHYLKEDAALLLGVAAWLVAADAHLRRPTWRTIALLAIGGGLAASGKWVGVPFALAGAGLAIAWPPSGRRALAATLALAGSAVVFLLINYPIFTSTSDLIAGLRFERQHVLAGRGDGLLYNTPLLIARQLLGWPNGVFAALALVEAAALVRSTERRREAWRWLVPATLLAFVAVLSLSSFFHPRHLLPAEVLLTWLAAGGAATLAAGLARRDWAKRVIAAALLVAPIVAQSITSVRFVGQLANDSRMQAARWLDRHAAGGSRVVVSHHAPLPGAASLKIEGWPEGTTVANLAADGVGYVVLSDAWHARFVDTFGTRVRPDAAGQVEAERRRLADLSQGHDLVWSFTNPEVRPRYGYASPSLRIYQLSD